MEVQKIIKSFNSKVNKPKMAKGEMLLRKRLVSSLELDRDSEINMININGEVFSESNKESYECTIEIDGEDYSIFSTECECRDYYNHSFYQESYFCKHLTALMLNFLSMEKNGGFKEEESSKSGEDFLKILEKSNTPKEDVALRVYLHKQSTYTGEHIQAEFKIGNKRLYSLKSLNDFVASKSRGYEIVYGKEFTYNPESCEFSEEDEKIIEYIEDAVATSDMLDGSYYRTKLIQGKYLNIPPSSLKRFLECFKNKKISLNGEEALVVKGDIPLEFSINTNENGAYNLKLKGELPVRLCKKGDVFIYEKNIYIPSRVQLRSLKHFYEEFSQREEIEFKRESGTDVFNKLLPTLEKISEKVEIDKSIEGMVRYPLKAKFYFDIKNKDTVVDVKLLYGEEELSFFSSNSEKIIIRDGKKEEEILNALKSNNILNRNNEFVFGGKEENLFDFLINGYKELEGLGEVYYSDKFKNRRVYKTPSIKGEIRGNKEGYLEFTFKIEDIKPKEYKNILSAFKEKKRYYKLKDSSFINLEEKETREFLEMVEALYEGQKEIDNMKFHKNRAVLISEFLENSSLGFIKGKDLLNETTEKLKNIESLSCEVPEKLQATLREYQVTGYKWFKTLSHLGFGGVLADEMGLGKTLQTIAFLLSEEGKKSLIVAPTSLIYNWKNEFKKFAPSLKIGVVHGNKKERDRVLEERDNYDVLLTTYGTLRNDEEIYSKITFDYCIIDEGQNIKNALAQSTKAVKDIKALVKFALTGTPIENNLLELWSIFDFVMPGYLYGSSIFKKKFMDEEGGVALLQKYIKPFILRRLKKGVILELPDKIEKKHYVEMGREQKKTYSAFVKDIKEKMENPDFDGDKITIFSYLTKLRQLCLHPSILVEGYNGGSGKLDAAMEIIKGGIEGGHKILLFSQFTSVLDIISKELNKNEISHFYLDGGTKATKRIDLVDEFNEGSEKRVFLISLKAGGTGLNLTSADMVIHFDPWWNPAIEEQATDRAHRIGQENVVEVFKLISEGTIEERIISLQEEKKELINNVMSGGYEGGNILSSLSKEEIMELFIS